MKFLIDMPLSPELVRWLEERGHGAVHALGLGMSSADDADLMALALAQERIVVTADLDFPQAIALTHAQGPPLILFRGGNYSEAQMRHLLQRVLDDVPERAGAISDSRGPVTRASHEASAPARWLGQRRRLLVLPVRMTRGYGLPVASSGRNPCRVQGCRGRLMDALESLLENPTNAVTGRRTFL